MSVADNSFSTIADAEEEAAVKDLSLAVYAPSSYALVIKVT